MAEETPIAKEWGIASDLRRLISDDVGNLSSKRALTLSWGFAALGVWIYVSIKATAMLEVPWSVAGIVFSLAGVTAVGKWGEGKKP